jgi:eukaryotic-like serine/threonine-protein kinase
MALTAGARLGPYEVTAQIGVGGMGEVWGATDINLGRQVAIKILPDAFAQDPDRLARFDREAKTLAALNHPNIAQIYGLERSETSTAIAMELVEGLTLADRIGQGALPVEEALPIAKQIAEALEAAHEQGVIHRDLKPANVKVRPDGTVKVLDFGLAKVLEPTSERSLDATASPTITSPALMTGVGVLLGTAAYMSPEQAKGRAVGQRADIWALGAVLFEMLTGKPAFAGEDVADTLAFVLTKEPDWTALPTNTPASIKRLLRRCLEKDRKRRLADSADARLEIEEALVAPFSAAEAPKPPRPGRQRVAWTAAQPFNPNRLELTGDPVVVAQNIDINIAGALSNVSASTTGLLSYRTTSGEGADSQLVWFDRSGKRLGTLGDTADQTEIQLSPDGKRAAISVLDPFRRTRDIWIYDLTRNGLRTRFTFDEGEDWASVWSPDGRSLIFSAGRPSPLDLYQKNADGSGAESKLVEGPGGPNKYVRSWSGDGRFVLFHSGEGGSSMGNDLWLLSLSEDRKPRPLLQTPFNELDGRFSPDGRWVAYRSNESGRNEIYVMPFAAQGGKWQVSTAGGDQPRWRRDGRELFYVAGNTIVAAEVNGIGPAFQIGTVRPLFDVRRRTTQSIFGTGSVYDVTADGQRFLVNVVAEGQEVPPPITVITNWTANLR